MSSALMTLSALSEHPVVQAPMARTLPAGQLVELAAGLYATLGTAREGLSRRGVA
jgi:hypothetical protein